MIGVSYLFRIFPDDDYWSSLNPTFIEEDCALAGVVARLAKNRLGDVFDLANASPIYIRNKVANTINERQKNKKS